MPKDDILIKPILDTIHRYAMISAGDKVVVAVSGGPDSTALLYALHALRNDFGISLFVAHLNHSLRGDESDGDEQYVRQVSADLGLDCVVDRADVSRIRRELRLSTEQAARKVRYDFLERIADKLNAHRIALGHTSDDHVETVLLNVLRGCGLDGLAGIPPKRGRIIRPLIETPRASVEQYLSSLGISPRTDSSNLSTAYLRNRIRLELLPLLRRDFNPRVDSAVLRLSELARDETTYLDMDTRDALRETMIREDNGELRLDLDVFLRQHTTVRRRILRDAIRKLKGSISNVYFVHISEILRLVETGRGFEYDLPAGGFVLRQGGELILLSRRRTPAPIIYNYQLSVPGVTAILELGLAVEAELALAPIEHRRPPGSGEVVLDWDAIVGKMIVRNWEPGDRITPLGMTGSKKLQDLFVDRKIPRAERCRLPIIADEQKCVWVVGVTLSELVKVVPTTRRFLILKTAPF